MSAGNRPMQPTNPIEAVFLDWDGTLLDSFEADSAAYLEMFQAMGIRWGREDMARHYSPDWYNVYRAARLDPQRWREADRIWRQAYGRHSPKLVAGARDVLWKLLRSYRLGLVTSGNRSRVTGQLRYFGLTSLFTACVCHEDAGRPKPHPEPLRLALRKLGRAAASSVYVGDSAEDMEMARRAGVRSIGIPGSFPTAKRLRASQPDALLASLLRLPALLEEWTGNRDRLLTLPGKPGAAPFRRREAGPPAYNAPFPNVRRSPVLKSMSLLLIGGGGLLT
ncbi:MAG TPA: HAD family hydrolase [Candidatus Dormibacteraeota bacterium]|nr:HAD family hydrolase [Candidatus Dormibacteraeota bacterium]